jgi:hypothetical protein
VVELHGSWIPRFLELQLLTLRASESPEGHQELEAALGELSGEAPPPLLRLAGWAELTALGHSDRAAELFTGAAVVTRYDEADLACRRTWSAISGS